VLILAAPGTAAGPGGKNVYTVDSAAVNTNLVLRPGKAVTVTAIGTFCPWGVGNPCVGPDGDPSINTLQSSYGGYVVPGADAWALVARVGSGPWVEVGSGPTRMSGDGVLVLAVNDDEWADNFGGYLVTVSKARGGPERECWPGWGWGDENHEHCGPPGQIKKTSGQSSGSSNGNSNDNSGEQGNSSSNGNSNGGGNGPKK
jgi:hypothetical protein